MEEEEIYWEIGSANLELLEKKKGNQ